MNFNHQGQALAKLEIGQGAKCVEIIKSTMNTIASDDQMNEFLDSYLNYRINQGIEDEKESKNYRSRVKAIVKNWKDNDKRKAIFEYDTKSVQMLAKYARDLNKKPKDEGEEESEEGTTEETLMSRGDIAAQLDRLAQHLMHYDQDLAQRLVVIASEVDEMATV
jgi:hypothetical protein